MTDLSPAEGAAGSSRGRRRMAAAVLILVVSASVLATGSFLLGQQNAPAPSPSQVPPGASGTATASVIPSPGDLSSIPIESGPPAGPGRVAKENLHAGSARWELQHDGVGDAEGWWSETSVAPGGTISLHLKSSKPTVTVTIWRLGWYNGAGARPVASYPDLPVAPQPDATTDPVSGMVRADWSSALDLTIPDTWTSGLYLGLLQPAGGAPQYTSFVVRERTPQAPILFIDAATTHEAYNRWGGKDLYPADSTGAPTASGDAAAVTVTFDRPYAAFRGAGLMMRWEYPFVRWMESAGYDVAYASDLDLERDPTIAAGRKLIIFAGHPEYWSPGMRAGIESAIAAGTNVSWFSANEIFWRVRFDPVIAPFRTITCYRKAALDPLTASHPELSTTQWREPPAPQPESMVIGEMYGHIVVKPADWVVSAPDSWVFAGTGVQAGDEFTNLVAKEYDRVFPAKSPPGLQILAVSPVTPDLAAEPGGEHFNPNESAPPAGWTANATLYTAPSGATVFAAGTLQWSWGLDSWGDQVTDGMRTPVDARVRRITANILNKLGT